MLPAEHRLRRSVDFRRCLRGGVRAGTATMTVHVLPGLPGGVASAEAAQPAPLVGLVVSKAVGNAVVRNRVSRRLRHLAAPHLPGLGDGTLVVLRAHPAAADADSAQLGADLADALDRAAAKARRRVTAPPAGSAS